MGSAVAFLMSKFGLGEKAARILFYVGLAVLAVSLFGIGKCTYDRGVIEKHNAKQRAANAEADRKADTKAAVERRADDARAVTEAQEVKEAINEAGSDPGARRRAYYACVSKQQSARNAGKPPADC